jgi:hypothetical protein
LSETTREEEEEGASSEEASFGHYDSMDDDLGIPDALRNELDRPIPSYRRIKAYGKRSKPFLHPPFVHSDRPTSNVRLSPDAREPEETGPQRIVVPQVISEEDDVFARSLGDKITLEAFDFPPPIPIPEECHRLVRNPRSLKHFRMLAVREMLHEFLPSKPGEHGMLYYDRDDLPTYIVSPPPPNRRG